MGEACATGVPSLLVKRDDCGVVFSGDRERSLSVLLAHTLAVRSHRSRQWNNMLLVFKHT